MLMHPITRHPYTIYIGPSQETMMEGVIGVVRVLTRARDRYKKTVALVTHLSGVMDTSWTVSTLQQAGYNVLVFQVWPALFYKQK